MAEGLDRIDRLVEIEAIKQLKARYFRTMDTKDWDGFRGVFTDDLHLEADGTVHDGADAFIAFLVPILQDVVTTHHGHMPEITLTGPDTATGVWAMFDYLKWPGDGPPMGFQGYGHYHEEYVRHDGEWRIRRLALTRLRIDPLEGGVPG